MLKQFTGDRRFHAHETKRMDELDDMPLASFRKRAWAIVIDFVALEIVRSLLGLHSRHHIAAPEGSFGWFVMRGVEELVGLAESALYFAVAVKLMNGQTLGKKLMKIRIISLTHHEIGWWQSIERALGYGASLLEGGFGFVQYYLHRNRQCVHDRIAETIVVDESPQATPAKQSETADVDVASAS